VCDNNLKKMINSFIQSGLNMMVLYMSNQSKFIFVVTYAGPLKSVSKDKNNLLSDDLLQMIDDTIFGNLFVDQHRFDYSEPSDNEDDDTLDPNMTVNIDEDVVHDVDDE